VTDLLARAADWRSRNDHSQPFGQCEHVQPTDHGPVRCEQLGCLHRERDLFDHLRVRHLCPEHGDQCTFTSAPNTFQA
jgi:hypothetical protein